ncbi:oxidoreductase [Rhizobium sophoriradicis]|uniref:oxidoreductase n=1 Tax=Rhizobium sophoriradicis TaxID=1535245 RepID=UPI001FE11219|nr:oxidoreductase [Rhizobium sophoriradicis]
MTDKNRSVALVTGASSGIGLATAESLVKAGYRVFGTSRKPVANRPGITMLICDVADEASVQAAVAEVVQQTGRLDLVVNNAGIGLIGGAEESSIAQAQRLFDVNVFGVARVANAVLPVMRKQKSGRIVNMSSILGLIPAPYNAFYASTKHALEGYSEPLDHEVRNFGIRVVPRPTRRHQNILRGKPDASRPTSSGLCFGTRPQRSADAQMGGDGRCPPGRRRHGGEAAMAKKPKLRYSAGKQSRQVRSLRRYLPERLVDSLLRKVNEFPASA